MCNFWAFLEPLLHFAYKTRMSAAHFCADDMQKTKQTFLLMLILALSLNEAPTADARRLRKKPKVYNALITTDDNLTSSRAYPLIQPTIHEAGYTPFGPYNPYAFYSPPSVRFGQPLVPGLTPNERLPYPITQGKEFTPSYETLDPNDPSEVPLGQRLPSVDPNKRQPVTSSNSDIKDITKEHLPLQLNHQGLPPMLIPVSSQYSNNNTPIHLPSYPYSQYPVIYDNTGYPYRREQYLPPFEQYPSHGYVNSAQTKPQQQAHQSDKKQHIQSEMQPLVSLPLDNFTQIPSFEDIINGSESKNSAVPDVPPPPIPSGPKRFKPMEK
ncbi:uncharacterized protein LOC115621441 [Scaptodrosophila lebanonensis]|uniref:Uncharacterized protein LOC115621441 n=1 Tax=Drosophila lebanonensis TaxID=7225 RepID=A0A6J2T6P9_DROLE|nr:uncharacterized protein LOC115621441 [Scaptodrosophila lebanonensis]